MHPRFRITTDNQVSIGTRMPIIQTRYPEWF